MNETITRGDIYYADLNGTIGCEQGGIRPVVIIQNDKGNTHSPTTIIAPITTRKKKHLPTHTFLQSTERNGLFKASHVSAEQIRVIDKSRLLQHIGRIDKNTMKKIDKAVIVSLALSEKRNYD